MGPRAAHYQYVHRKPRPEGQNSHPVRHIRRQHARGQRGGVEENLSRAELERGTPA